MLDTRLSEFEYLNFVFSSGKELAPGETAYLIKRCIAIEGDTVMIQRKDKLVEMEVPPGHAWLESDNHNFQSGQYPDSLKFGPIPMDEVWGRAVWCYRRKALFETLIPLPQNYEWNVPIEDAIPHQRVRFSHMGLTVSKLKSSF